MPLQGLVSEPALRKIDKLAEGGDPAAKRLATYWVGQGVGLMNDPHLGAQRGLRVHGGLRPSRRAAGRDARRVISTH